MNEKIEKALGRVLMWYRRYSEGLAELGGTPLPEDLLAAATREAALEDYDKVKGNLDMMAKNRDYWFEKTQKVKETLAEVEYYGESPTMYIAKVEAYTKLEAEHETLKEQLEKQRPLIEAVMSLSEADAEMGETGELVRAAVTYKEQSR